MSEKMAALAENAQWFEDNSPLDPSHKKENVVGVSYKTVNVAAEAGDALKKAKWADVVKLWAWRMKYSKTKQSNIWSRVQLIIFVIHF